MTHSPASSRVGPTAALLPIALLLHSRPNRAHIQIYLTVKTYQFVVVLGTGDAEEPGQALAPRVAVAEQRRAGEPGVVHDPGNPARNKFNFESFYCFRCASRPRSRFTQLSGDPGD